MQRTRNTLTPAQDEAGGPLFESWMRERAPHAARVRALWTMTPAQRVAAMYRRELTYGQLAAWAASRPHEVPLLDGEFWFIAVSTPESAEPDRASRERQRELQPHLNALKAREPAREARRLAAHEARKAKRKAPKP